MGGILALFLRINTKIPRRNTRYQIRTTSYNHEWTPINTSFFVLLTLIYADLSRFCKNLCSFVEFCALLCSFNQILPSIFSVVYQVSRIRHRVSLFTKDAFELTIRSTSRLRLGPLPRRVLRTGLRRAIDDWFLTMNHELSTITIVVYSTNIGVGCQVKFQKDRN